ncbi:MFS transporter [Bradyrhizobium barranii]|uniref:MFS transporter n=1 Tax=Bradyrhizobium barranii TaxID=2992140 RepID=A0ABY3QR92_9BRAD|nr:YbfB/YjiJ family MFS transporter [Bradyrhizobium japonicum]UFW88455.1 MFS transporter [Bradyrhizobium japonicum]
MNNRHLASGAASASSPWRATAAGLCATLVGIGLARFAYTPLLPAVIGAHWFDASAAAYIGAANLAGYLAGALLAHPMLKVGSAAVVIRTMMLLAAAAFIACALPLSFLWFFTWRLASGVAGGVLMVLAAPTVLSHVSPSRRGLAGGVIFMGVGIGIAASGTVVPLLLEQGLQQAWLGLGALAFVLTLLAWNGWPVIPAPAAPVSVRAPRRALPLRLLYAEYGLNAVGLVPHMLFLVDFVARGLGRGVQTGAQYWVLFGVGAIIGPLITGRLADVTGFRRALRIAYALQAVAVGLPAFHLGTAGLMFSSLVVGAFTPGIVALVLGRVHELTPHDATGQKAAWSAATTSFAVMQAVAAFGLSFIFERSGGDYSVLFLLGAASLAVAFLMDFVAGTVVPEPGHPQ